MYEVFKNLIDSKGLKAADVCRGTGLPSSFFSEWKRGKSNPKYDKIKLIADFLGVSPEYIMTGEESSPAPENPEGLKPYYLDPETARIAQELKDSPGRRTLMDASRGMTPDQINAIVNMIETMHGKDDYDEPC